MRLTLRTLLAYMDGILEPADAQDLGKKIEESEFAKNLLHRARDVARRLRLAAPKLEGKGMGLDPNTVAEYLDNTLASERVSDFEKVCLESDVHLAEVASAHQVLALVLGEPAEVEPRCRQRMYNLIADCQSAVESKAETAAPEPPPQEKVTPAAQAEIRTKPEIPDYLREPTSGGRWVMRAAVAVLLLAVVGAGLAALLVPKEHWPGWLQTMVAQGPPAGQALDPDAVDPNTGGPAEESGPPATGPDETPGAVTDLPEAGVRPDAAATPSTTVPPTGGAPELLMPTETTPPTTVAPTPPGPELGTTTPAGETPPTPPLPGEGPLATPPTTPQPDVSPPPEPAPAKGVGRMISDQEVLLRFNAERSSWARLPARATLYTGDRLLALPSYRAKVALTADVTIDIFGESLVQLEAPDAEGVPGIRIHRGRLIVFTVRGPQTRLRVAGGQHQGVATFGDADSMMALEVRNLRKPGEDPEAESTRWTIDLYATSGEILWSEPPNPEPDQIRAPAHRSLGPVAAADETTPAPALTFPAWITMDQRGALEKQASLIVEEYLEADRSVSIGLKELLTDRRSEVNLLALKCLAEIGHFEDFIPMLRDPAQRLAWTGQLECLSTALDHGPETAARIRESFQKQHGPAKGAELYRVLWGYSAQDLQDGGAAKLVEYLEHENLEFRVFAFWSLRRITGLTLFYQPQDTEIKRRPAVIKWKQRLESGQIVPKSGAG